VADGADYVEVVLARPDRADVLLGIKYHPPQVQFARFPDRTSSVAQPVGAERMARTCAKRSGVDLWFSEGPSGFTLLARFRGTTRQHPRRTRSTDGGKSKRPKMSAR